MNLRGFTISSLAIVLLSLPPVGSAQQPEPGQSTKDPISGDSVAARVNGREIKISEIDQVMRSKPAFAMYQTMNNKSPEMLNKLRVSVLNSMIDRQLLLDAAAKAGTSSEEVDKKTGEVVARYGGEAKLKEILKTSGMPYEQFLGDLRDDFIINAYLDSTFEKDILISDSELKKVFDASPQRFAQREEAHARHILIKVDKDAGSEEDLAAKNKIEELHAQVTSPGGDFGAIAREHSQCPSSSRGGDLGFFPRGAMVAPFEKAAFGLKPGEISDPIKTDFGYHIIKLEEKREAAQPDFESAKPKIQRELLHRKRAELIEARVKELRDKAKVEIELQG
ncbi:MAG: peptidylprolyl isomerase [Deltaproteobacteria bacterium]|nr:peptidylprolyl isomerase [Deltaproteobacteria bacterium]